MSQTPETRITLIQRLQRGTDDDAWAEFASIYRPAIVRMGMLKGLQAADADDVAQRVLVAVSRNIHKWKQDSKRARFRTWLQTVVRNATINALQRRPRDQAQGGTTAVQVLESCAGEDDSQLFDREWRRETFRWAADQVRDEFQSATWDAFWLTAVEGLAPPEAAERLGKSVGAIYIARTRVMQRIKAKVDESIGES